MGKVSQHLAGFHKTAAAHHDEMSIAHRALSESFAKCASMSKVKQADESAAELLQGCADAHSHAAKSHDAQAEYHKEAMAACSKAIEAGDVQKTSMEPEPLPAAPRLPVPMPVIRFQAS